MLMALTKNKCLRMIRFRGKHEFYLSFVEFEVFVDGQVKRVIGQAKRSKESSGLEGSLGQA